jgi:hypothetical protein
MLRALIRRDIRHINGAEFQQFETVDFDCAELEYRLHTRGGCGGDVYDISTLLGIETLEDARDAEAGGGTG